MDAPDSSTKVPPIGRELIGLLVLAVCAVGAWSSLIDLLTHVAYSRGQSFAWRGAAWLGGPCLVAAYTTQRSGLLALACSAQGRAPSEPALGAWFCWFSHFKVSAAASCAALLACGLLREKIAFWLLAPISGTAWGPNSFHYDPARSGPWLVALCVLWLPCTPFLASDVWRLILPLPNARARRLRIPFVLASSLVAVSTVLLVRWAAAVALQGSQLLAWSGG